VWYEHVEAGGSAARAIEEHGLFDGLGDDVCTKIAELLGSLERVLGQAVPERRAKAFGLILTDAPKLLDLGVAKPDLVDALRDVGIAAGIPALEVDDALALVFAARKGNGHEQDKKAAASEPEIDPDIVAMPFVWAEPKDIPPRQWLYGSHVARKFVSVTLGTGSAGKTAVVLAEKCAFVSGRDLLNDGVRRCGRAWYLGLEDPYVEYQRRIAAIVIQYGLKPSDLGGLYLNSSRDGRFVIATETHGGVKILVPRIDAIKAQIRRNSIDWLSVDPFVASHLVSENNNVLMAEVARQWTGIADECGVGIDLLHHLRKPSGDISPDELSVDDARGASSLATITRSARLFTGMSKIQASEARVEEKDRRRHVQMLLGLKPNLALPMLGVRWRKLVTVKLGNATADDPEDELGVAIDWELPSSLEGVTVADLDRVLVEVGTEPKWRADARSPDWVGFLIGRVLDLDVSDEGGKQRVHKMIKTWLANKALEEVRQDDKKGMPRKYVIRARSQP
jgi:hypothetical protein